MRTLVLVSILCGLNFISSAVEVGDPIGDPFMGVQAVSRGAWDPDDPNEPLELQCVDLAKDFARRYHITLDNLEVGTAANMWTKLPQNKGYQAIENDSSVVQPQVGDLVIWWGGSAGHVAIVSRLTRFSVEVFEQNVSATDPYRTLTLAKNEETGTWHLPSGLGGSYYIKGWLRYPSFSVIGRYDDGSTWQQQIKDCYDRESGYQSRPDMGKVGWPIDDGGGVFVHNWAPFRYLCQNFRNAQSQESIIMYDPFFGSQAYRISGVVWEYYRYGYGGRYGPDILLPNGKRLGGPTSNEFAGIQYFENGFYCEKLNAALPTKSMMMKAATQGSSIVVELHQLDGALVATYCPTGEFSSLTANGKAQSQNHNTVIWLGGPTCAYYSVLANVVEIGQTTLLEFTEAGLSPGTVRTYQVLAKSASGEVLATSNEVTVVSPGEPGVILLQGAAEGCRSSYIEWNNTQWPYAPWSKIFRDDVEIAKSAGDAFSDFPLEPNTTYKYQIAPSTASNMILGWSNPVWITTAPAPPPPPPEESVVTSVQIQIEQTLLFGTTCYVTGMAHNQFGDEMPDVRLLFISSDNSTLSVSCDSGYCIANNIGTVEVWAEVYDARGIQSERVTVNVVAEIPPEPIHFDSSPLQLDCDFELISTPPFLGYHPIMIRVYPSNPTDQAVTFYIRGFVFREDGSFYDNSSFSSTPVTLAPGESGFYLISSIPLPEAGRCFVQVHTCPTRSMVNTDWQVIDQTAPGINHRLWLDVISEADLKAELVKGSFTLLTGGTNQITEVDDVHFVLWLRNDGDRDITTPFSVTVSQAGLGSQTAEVASLSRGGIIRCDFNFGKLPVGSYKFDLFIDSTNAVDEYNEANNTDSLIVQVIAAPKSNLTITNLSVSPAELRVGSQAIVSGDVPNNGNAEASPCQLQVSFGDQVATVDLPAIPAGNCVPFSASFSLTAEGMQTVTAVVDSGNVVAESDEGDNIVLREVTVLPSLRSDLSITGFQVTSPQLYLGQLGEAAGIVENKGNADSVPCQLAVSFDGQTVTLDLPAIPAGNSVPFSATVSFTTEGEQTITATVDSSNVVVESNEGNNSSSASVVILPPPKPNVVITQASYLPNPIYASQTITILYTEPNIGQAVMPAHVVGVLNGQSLCGTAAVPALAPGQSYSGQISFGSLVTWRGVTFTIIADFTNIAQEENESDNAKPLPVSFLPVSDVWDPADDAVSGATALNDPTATEQTHGQHILSSIDHYDWFKVYLTKNRRYNFNTAGGTGNDYGELYSNSTGTIRIAYNDDSGGNFQFSFTYKPNKTGWYYLRVRAYAVGSNCSYSLKYKNLGS